MIRKTKIKKHDIVSLYKEYQVLAKVAECLGLSEKAVQYYVKKYNIDLKTYKNRFPYTKEELIELHDKYGSITKVAASLNKSYSTVRHWYSSFDIVVNNSGMTVFHEIRTTEMTETHKAIVIGSMLGDGGLWLAPHCKNARLYISHCEKQLGYLEWLHSILNPFSRPIKMVEKEGKKIICDREVNNSNFFRFYTIAHPDITSIFKTYYKDGFKRVDYSLVDKVNLLAMSIWFADDGTIQRDRHGIPFLCDICTNSFTYKEHLILVEIVRKFFKGTIIIKEKNRKDSDKEEYFIRMKGKKEVNDFLSLIMTILPECIHYKLS